VGRLPETRPLLYYITDRKALPAGDPLPVIERAAAAGVDLIQIRERDLSTRALLALVQAAQQRLGSTAARLLVNDRVDIAAVARTGVHLPTHGLPVAQVRRRFPDLLLGASSHNLEEVRTAEEGGADFVVFGPVYETPSKKPYGPPVGLEKLAAAVRAAKIPVLALGGITPVNAGACLQAGAAGLAAISLFQTSPDLAATVSELRRLARPT
jgi:thiamine-phosphate pyrophosphorylase